MRLTSRFGYVNQIRRDRPLTHEELMHHVPGIFGEDRHTSCRTLCVHPHHHRTGKPAAGRLSSILRLPDPRDPDRREYTNTCCVCAVTER